MCEKVVRNKCSRKYELNKDVFLPCMTGYGENRSTRLPVVVRHRRRNEVVPLSPSGHYLLGYCYLMNRAEEEGRELKWATTSTTSSHRRTGKSFLRLLGVTKKGQFCEITSIFLVACMGCPLLFFYQTFCYKVCPSLGGTAIMFRSLFSPPCFEMLQKTPGVLPRLIQLILCSCTFRNLKTILYTVGQNPKQFF